MVVVVGFRVRVYDNDDKDRIRVHDDASVMVNNVMTRLISIAGWGSCLEWLHPPPKGIQLKGGREREGDDKSTRELREKELLHSFPRTGLNSYKKE